MKPLVAIVGRPNVGKSALFNRLVQRRSTIVDDTPGVTRDRVYEDTLWNGKWFTLIDTGGLGDDLTHYEVTDVDGHDMSKMVTAQTRLAIDEANVLVFVVDGKQEISPADFEVADLLRKSNKPVILAVNKAESPHVRSLIGDFYRLGLGEPIPVSAIHGTNTGDLLDMIVSSIPVSAYDPASVDEPAYTLRVSIVGRPNVGKSSLLNAIVGENRTLVSEIPGTTRDAVDVVFDTPDGRIVFVDTAGLRRPSKIPDSVEKYSVFRALEAAKRSDIAILVLDATEEIVAQDRRIAGHISREKKGCMIVVNKWDLVEDKKRARAEIMENIKWRLGFIDYAPVSFVSAKAGQGIERVLKSIREVMQNYSTRISTGELNRVIGEIVTMNPPPASLGIRSRLYYCTQIKTEPPTFLFFVSDIKSFTDSYMKYLESRLREYFDFSGTPLRLILRKRE